jgi:hypothetical protein
MAKKSKMKKVSKGSKHKPTKAELQLAHDILSGMPDEATRDMWLTLGIKIGDGETPKKKSSSDDDDDEDVDDSDDSDSDDDDDDDDSDDSDDSDGDDDDGDEDADFDDDEDDKKKSKKKDKGKKGKKSKDEDEDEDDSDSDEDDSDSDDDDSDDEGDDEGDDEDGDDEDGYESQSIGALKKTLAGRFLDAKKVFGKAKDAKKQKAAAVAALTEFDAAMNKLGKLKDMEKVVEKISGDTAKGWYKWAPKNIKVKASNDDNKKLILAVAILSNKSKKLEKFWRS